MTRERRYDLVALAVLAALPSLVFFDVLFGLKSFFIRDILQYYYPVKHLLREIALGGEFPFWNPWFAAGQPLAANPQNQVFYPLTWLILLPGFHRGFQLLILVHVYIAAFGMYALLRSMKLSRTASCFGALSFALSGLFASLLNLFPILFSFAWLPLTCLFARRYLLGRARRDFALAATFLGLQLVVSEPVVILQSGFVLGVYALHRGWGDARARGALRAVAVVGALSLTAILVAAVQVLPAADLLRDSVRSRGIGFESVAQWSMPPFRAGEMLFPNLAGVVGTDTWWGTAYSTAKGPFFYSIYAGLAVAVLFMAGLAARVRGGLAAAAICGVSYIAAMGDHTPLLRLLYDTGAMSSFRFPEKFVLMGGFAAVVFAAKVLDRLLRGDTAVKNMVLVFSSIVGVLTLAVAAFGSTHAYETLFRGFWGLQAERQTDVVVSLSRQMLTQAAIRAALLFALFFTATRRRIIWAFFLCAFLLLDLGPICRQVAPTIDPRLYATPRVVHDFAPQHEQFRIFNYAHRSRRFDEFRRFNLDSYWLTANALAMYLPAAYGLRSVLDVDYDVTYLQSTTDFEEAAWALAKRRPRDWINFVAPMTNLWYVGVNRSYEAATQSSADDIRRIEPVRFLEGKHWPRYYFAPQVVTIRDEHDFVEKLASARFAPQTAFVEGASFAPARGAVRGVRESANSAQIEVESSGRAFLVLSVTPHKYWQVTLDGRPVSPVVTNVGFQGVVVPAGRHLVAMRYRNPLVIAGAAISALTLLALAIVGRRRAAPLQCAPCD